MVAKKRSKNKKVIFILILLVSITFICSKFYIVHSKNFENKFKLVKKNKFSFKEIYIDLDPIMMKNSKDKLKALIEGIEWMKSHPEIKLATSQIDWTIQRKN